MHDGNSFVTLTYDQDHIPYDFGLHHRDYQLFMKRLRKQFRDVRYFMCGEYGEKSSRPHFHALLFNCFFSDRYVWRKSGAGHTLYRSSVLEDIWTKGNVEIGDVTFESAAYVARYCVTEVSSPGREWIVDPETGELFERKREYNRMSLKPGIGATWFAKYKAEVFPLDRVVVRGRDCVPPKFYKQLLDRLAGTMSDDVEYSRYCKSLKFVDDSTEARLRAREIVCKARNKSLRRSVDS